MIYSFTFFFFKATHFCINNVNIISFANINFMKTFIVMVISLVITRKIHTWAHSSKTGKYTPINEPTFPHYRLSHYL